ncbi:unnamed protein product, partial [Iphiclides podalirius]
MGRLIRYSINCTRMSEPRGRGRARGRAGRGNEGSNPPPRRPGEQQHGPPHQQSAAPGPRPQPPSAWGPPTIAPAVRAGVPMPSVQAGRASHRTTPTTHHPGDVDIQQRMQAIDLGQASASGAGDASSAVAGRGCRRGGGRVLPEQTLVLRTRPSSVTSKRGSYGHPLDLISNYFAVETTPQWCLYQYRVDISPDEDSTAVRKGLLKIHSKILGGYLFDGTVLYTIKRLHPEPLELYSDRKTDGERMRILIKLTCDVTPGDYHYIQVFNIIIRKCFNLLQLQLVGRDFFDPVAKIDIPEYKLQIWPGYKTTINQYEDKILMVTEIAHKVLRMDTVLQMLNEYTATKGANCKKIFLEDIVGKIVMTDYNKKTYRVDDVTWQATPKSTFKMKDGDITYIDYYYKKYNIRIQDVGQPLLISRSKARDIRAGMPELVYLVPELCRQTGLSDSMRANFQLMRTLAVHTKIGPDMRIKKLLDFNRRLTQTKEVVAELATWDMKLSNRLINIKGRQLPPENIVQGNNIKYPAGDTTDGWTRDMRSKPLLSLAAMPSWVVITPDRQRQDTGNFINMIIKTGEGVGFHMPRPEIVTIQRDGNMDYANMCENVIARKNPSLILCVLARNYPDRYEAIKKKCTIDRAVPTQVVCARNMSSKSAMSIATKIAIQINCKLGGAPWTVEIPLNTLMVIGYDVCHDTRSKEKSFGAFVATLDKQMTQYYSAVNAHTSGEELSAHMSFNIASALRKYRERNGTLPSRIFIYRDGVGDGQIPYVHSHEVTEIKKKLNEIYGGAEVKMAFIIVSKRINTRIFVNTGRSGENPKPGTIIDDVVTLPERYDFYLVSQNVREGTISPTSYNVIEDTTGLEPDRIQRLTYKLTYLYFNCSNQVRMDTDIGDDVITTLRSDLAGLQYKRDKLLSENSDLKNQMLSRDQRILEQQVEIDHLREQNARQNAIISSLKKKIQDLEELQRNLQASQNRNELSLQTLQRDNRYCEEKIKDYEKKIRSLEIECHNEEEQKENARGQFHDLVRRLSAALDSDFCDTTHTYSPESLIIKAAELVQEITRLKNKCINTTENLSTIEQDLRSCRDSLERANADKDILQRQLSTHVLDIERLKQEKESLIVQNRVIERELHEAREKLSHCTKNLNVVTDNVNQNESMIIQLKEDLRHRDEKHQRLQTEFRNTMESIAILLSLPTRFVEAHESTIKDRIREILGENKDKTVQIETLRDKLGMESQQLNRTSHMNEQANTRVRILEDERNMLEGKVHKLESEITSLELSRDNLHKDKANFVAFLERLSRTLNMDELTQDVGIELHTESIIHRAEQLARLESDKIVDKTAVVYQLQRRIRILREQLQRKDLHLDLLRRKLSVQDESCRVRAVLQAERDEAVIRSKKLARQCDKLGVQLSDARAQLRDLNAQLADAAEYKISSLERARKIEELQKKLEEAELLRTRYSRKVNVLKEQIRNTGENFEQERNSSEHQIIMLRDDLARTKEALADCQRREAQLQSFRNSIAKLLGILVPSSVSDFEMVSRLQKLIDAHHDFTVVSRRYDDPALLRAASRSPPPSRCRTRTPDRSLRYDDSGYADPAFDLEDELYKNRAGL